MHPFLINRLESNKEPAIDKQLFPKIFPLLTTFGGGGGGYSRTVFTYMQFFNCIKNLNFLGRDEIASFF